MAMPAGDVTLTCQPSREGDLLVFAFRLLNDTGGDIYVFDAIPTWDAVAKKAGLDHHNLVVALSPDKFVHLTRGIAPLPPDRDVVVRIIPLAVRLPPGETLARTLELRLPMHEASPYYPDLPVRDYRQVDIAGVELRVEFLRASAEGFAAAPVDGAPDLYRVMARNTVGMTSFVTCRLPARGLTVLRRPDPFTRPE
jgi:hypothetical protein